MSSLLGLERQDGRNLLIVASVIFVIMTALTSGSIGFRLTVGIGAALISGIAFLISTLIINRYKPDHW